jgi:hypothetical protein
LARFGLRLGEIASDAEGEGDDEFRIRLTLGEGGADGCTPGGEAFAAGDKSVADRFNFFLFASELAFFSADGVEAALAVCSGVGGALLRSGKRPAVIALANPE